MLFYPHRLEEIIEALLSFIEETELWDSVTPVIPLFEKIVATLVNNMQAENGENTQNWQDSVLKLIS